jgi:DNA-binding response OmpR family regulator
MYEGADFMKVLIVEDEPQVSQHIKEGLEEKFCVVNVAYDGLVAKRLILDRDYDVVVLDVIIPGMNGFDLCKTIKAEKPGLPVLMLSTLGTTADKLEGFDCGADDYLIKPFDFDELVARLKALARRSSSRELPGQSILRYEDLKLDTTRKVALRGNKPIKLSVKEFSMLEYFLSNPGRVISRAELAEMIWGIKFETGTNTVEVYMSMLRSKIDRDFKPKLLQTRVGHGYVLSAD